MCAMLVAQCAGSLELLWRQLRVPSDVCATSSSAVLMNPHDSHHQRGNGTIASCTLAICHQTLPCCCLQPDSCDWGCALICRLWVS